MFGPLQLILILVIVIVIFGAGKVPNLMGDIGKGIKNFRKNVKDEDGDAKLLNEKKDEE
ncbi:MAG: sec-independent protein translocase protein TatA [Rickettsiales bacterium]|jgi:sec-independent protein translocase protein TatA